MQAFCAFYQTFRGIVICICFLSQDLRWMVVQPAQKASIDFSISCIQVHDIACRIPMFRTDGGVTKLALLKCSRFGSIRRVIRGKKTRQLNQIYEYYI
jgi:hypothetical protein